MFRVVTKEDNYIEDVKVVKVGVAVLLYILRNLVRRTYYFLIFYRDHV